MKRLIVAALFVTLTSFCAGAQEKTAQELSVAYGKHYEVSSELGEADAKALAQEMDRRFEVFEKLFRFDPALLPGKMKIHAFKDSQNFNDYLIAALGDTREGAAYLHYPRPERCELTVLRDGKNATARAFAHQALVQYLRAFVPNPPTWMREGFAIYFETVTYDPAKDELGYEENLGWLETVKSWGDTAPDLGTLILTDEDEQTIDPAKLQPASWALVSFLLNADNEDYRRTLYESFMLLSPTATAAENARAVNNRAAAWLAPEEAKVDYSAYLSARKTFTEVLEEGRAAYAAHDVSKAEAFFMHAATLRPNHYAPHYYLGLLAYDRKDYKLAENHYRTALEYGADEALVNYALGVNAAADGRNAEARNFLERAKNIAPTRYKDKVEELLARLK